MRRSLIHITLACVVSAGCGPSKTELEAQRKIQDAARLAKLQGEEAADSRARAAKANAEDLTRRAALARTPEDAEDAQQQAADATAFANYAKMDDRQAVGVMKNMVLVLLKDPGSAQFRAEELKVTSKGKALCGDVNAKNAMGGYVGFKGFVVYGSRAAIETDVCTSATDFACQRRMRLYTELLFAGNC